MKGFTLIMAKPWHLLLSSPIFVSLHVQYDIYDPRRT